MNIDNIYQLLDRYMEGENTQEELCILKKFFKECNNLPDDLLPYRDMFDIPENVTEQELTNSYIRLLECYLVGLLAAKNETSFSTIYLYNVKFNRL